MKTFTNCAEKKAKQILNLLQGYTRGIRITAILILLLMGVSNAWGVERIYLKLDAWKDSGARYAARFYNDQGNEYWQNMYETSISQVFACDIPADGITYNKVIFVRLNPSGSDSSNGGNNWNNKWNQSGDITFQKNKLCTQNNYWDSWTGNWSSITWYITGSFNEWKTNNSATSYTLNANTTYEFKVYSPQVGYFSNEGTMDRGNHSNWDMYANVGNCKLTTDFTGTYTFTYNGDKMNVTYPAAYTVTYGVGTTKGTTSVTTDPSITSGSLVLASTSITFSKGTTKTGYQWKNWNTNANGTGTNLGTNATYTSSNRNANTTVYACYDLITYNIKYNLNGGTGATNTTYNVESATITLPTAPTKTGYTFAGWYDNANLTGNKVTQVAKGSTGDKEFWAKWTPNTYTITYKDQGNTTFSGTHASGYPTTHTYGTETTLKTASKTGYTFEGWYKESACTNKVSTLGATEYTADITLYAKWTPVPTLEISTNQQYLRVGKDKLQLSITYANIPDGHCYRVKVGDGYYNGNANGENNDRVSISGSGSVAFTTYSTLPGGTQPIVVELWTSNTFGATSTKSNTIHVTVEQGYQVSIYKQVGSTKTPLGVTISPTEHIGETATASALAGYTFTGWTSNTANITFKDASALSTLVYAKSGGDIYANFSTITYTITYNLNNGTGTMTPTSYTVETETFNLPTPTHAGYTFAGWFENSNLTGVAVTQITKGSIGNKTFYAKWIEQKEIYLVGEFGWDNPSEEYKFKAHPTKPGVYTLTKHFNKRDRYDMTDPYGPGQPEYEFKLMVNGTKYTVKTENGKKILQYTRQSKTKVLSDGNNYNSDPYYNLLLQADISGDYVFEYNVESKELTVEHPAYLPEASFIVGDFSDGQTGTDVLPKDGGAGHDWTEEHGIKFNGNTAKICFNGTGKTWEFKIKINGVWYGAKDLVITGDDTYTLTDDYAFQSETNCAIQTSGVNGCYTFSYTEKGNGEIELTVGYPKQSENPTTVYLKPNDEWKAESPFSITYSEETIEMEALDCNGEYYVVEIPAGIPEFQFKNKSGATTLPLSVPSDNKVLYDMTSTNITHIYLKPNSNWLQSGAKFEAYFWNNNGNDWVTMEHIGNNIYRSEKKRNNVLFNRIDPSNGYNKWSRTKDLVVPSNGTNLFEIDKNASTEYEKLADGKWYTLWDNSKWTTYTEPTYDVTINITGKGAIVINGQTYEGTSEGKTTLKIEDVVVNTAFNINSITAAERWDYTSNGTIKIASNGQEPLKVEGSYEICGPTTINLEFIQKYCLVTFLPNPPRGLVYPEQINPQVVVKGKKAVQPTIVELEGYLFAGWYPNGSTYTDANKFDFDTPIEQDIELCARWVPYEQCIFFKNNLNWDNIYVYTFSNNVWHNGDNQENPNDDMGVQPKVNHIEHGLMTQIGYTDVYYYILTSMEGFKFIAFSDFDMSNYDYFHEHNAIYRSDRSDQMQLFIPQKDQTAKTHFQTGYYSEGIWMKYNSIESGYKWKSDKDWNADTYTFTAPNKGGYSFTTKVSLEGGKDYLFKINNIKKDWFGHTGTMTQDDCTDWWFETRIGDNATIQPNATGDYLFTIYLGDGKVMLSLEYPLAIGDYRLAYKDKTADSFHPGHYIRKRSKGTHRDTTSFFVLHDKAPAILLQECTDINTATGVVTWKTLKEYSTIEKVVAKTTVYNFVLLQNENVADLAESETHLYTGDFYIRTDDAPGGWDYFRQNSNKMTFSSYAQQNENFDHYFCKWIHKDKNVRYTVANDYSYCISDTLYADAIIGGTYGNIEELPANANVRFMWDSRNNSIGRAYIAGSSNQADRFLVVEGKDNNLKDAAGNDLMEGQHNTNRFGLHANEEILKDMGNWIYQVDVKANKDAWIKLTALYDGTIQYFKGAADGANAYIRMLTSDATDTYKIRLIYDFKINQLIIAWLVEDNTITEENTVLGADMMIIRHNQERAKQLNFDPNNRSLEGVGKAYAVLTFDKYFLNNRTYPTADGKGGGNVLPPAQQQSQYARALYWVSFPFNVKLSEVSGFGEYGDYWILEYYDGADRAQNGLWVDTDTYWKYITNPDYTIQAGQGYVLSLNLNKMGYESTVFTNTAEVSLFFPSTGPLTTITGELPTAVEVPAHECTIERENGIHKIYDSHWNMIGVPGFADIENVPVGDNLFNEGRKLIDEEEVTFYYQYVPEDNTYDAKSKNSENFQLMYSYMVQYYGTINWMTPAFNGPSAIAARSASSMPSEYNMLLELASSNNTADQTYIKLQEERATVDFDLNLDLTKIMNHGENIYTLTGSQEIKCAGNTLPIQRITVPVGVRVDAAGEYTFRMPNGTDGIAVTLVDNATGTHTNMLMSEYTVTLNAGTIENRFYLVVDPDRTATSVENIGEGAKGDKAKGVEKFLIDGKLFIRTADGIFDAKGQRL